MLRIAFALAAAGSCVGLAQAQVDGSILGDGYGFPYAIQSVETQFGDANPNGGSELDAAFARISGGRLYLALTGNLENNFNKLEILLQSGPGGSNVYSGNPGNDGTFRMTGMTFDAGFAPNYHIVARRGFNGQLQSPVFDIDFANLNTPNFSNYGNIFGGADSGSGSTGIGLNAQPIEIAYDGSNVAGVVGGTGPANQLAAASVFTGFEMSIALSDLGLQGVDGEQICVMAFVNGSNHDYASNQFLPGLPAPQGNLGGDGAGTFTGSLSGINMNNFAGDQFFCVPVPAPSAFGLLALGGIAAVRRRR